MIGGPREVTLACLMAARLTAALIEPFDIPPESLRERADRARGWSGTLTVPGEVRAMLMRVIELAGRVDRAAAAAALDDLAAAASLHLDEQSRAELRMMSRQLTEAPAAETANENLEIRAS